MCDAQTILAPGKGAPEILRDVQAVFQPRAMHACIGQSGSGKTTLLSILSGRGHGVFRGSMLLNGAAIDYTDLKHHANLVPQEDVMFDVLTLRETLTWYMKMRLPPASAATTTRRVEALMERMGLASCADVHVGNPLRPGISGGQKKRLSIAMELVDNPSCLFCDEPTSGLDSGNQESVISFLRDLADGGCTVVATVHSPTMHIYSLFDSVIYLVRNVGVGRGSVAFQGGVGEGVSYFATLGHPLVPFANAAEAALACLDKTYGPLGLPTLWRLRRLQLLYQALPAMGGADEATIGRRLGQLIHVAGQANGAAKEAVPQGQVDALARCVAECGGTYLGFVRAMLACAGDSGLAVSEALDVPHAAVAPDVVARLDDIASRMHASPWLRGLYCDFSTAVAARMGVCGSRAGAASDISRLTDQVEQMAKALQAGSYRWHLSIREVVTLLSSAGFTDAMGLAARPRAEAFVAACARDDGTVLFGNLAMALHTHAQQHLAGGAPPDDADSALAIAFPGGRRLDGEPPSQAQRAAYTRFLDADNDGAFGAADVEAYCQACRGAADMLGAAKHGAQAGSASQARFRSGYPNSFPRQYWLLLSREFRQWGANTAGLLTTLAMGVIIILFLGGMYWRIPHTQSNFTNLVAALFLTCLFTGMLPLNTTMLEYPREQVVVRREFGNGIYSSPAYFLAKWLFLVVTRGGPSLLISIAVYWMADLSPSPATAGNFLLFAATILCVVTWSTVSGFAFGIVIPNAEAAAAISLPFLLVNILFSGFYETRSAIPPWFIWAYYLSFFRYALAILVHNLFNTLRFTGCGKACFFGPDGTGRAVERQYGVEDINVGAYFGICITWIVVMGCVGYGALLKQFTVRLRRKPKKPTQPEESATFRLLGVRSAAISSGDGGTQTTAPAAAQGPKWLNPMRLLRRRRPLEVARPQT